MTVGDLFWPEPQQYGLRGDGPLWRHLAGVFSMTPLPQSASELQKMVYDAGAVIIGDRLENIEQVECDQLKRGGMSSGYVHGATWRGKLMPLLLQRFDARG